jgi:hypothetical protein
MTVVAYFIELDTIPNFNNFLYWFYGAWCNLDRPITSPFLRVFAVSDFGFWNASIASVFWFCSIVLTEVDLNA